MDQGFFLAAFGIDGELEGTGQWQFTNLSDKWLGICEDYLKFHGTAFDAPWGKELAHIRTRLTSASGAALVTLSAYDVPVASVALASGHSPSTESSVLGMFVKSLREMDLVRAAAQSGEAFKEIFDIEGRPLMVVVPWAYPDVSDEDQSLVRELSLHLAAAYFRRHDETLQSR